MTDNYEKKPAPIPWRWRLALARLICALVLGFVGFLWAAWLMLTGRGWESILWMITTWVCARLLAGSLYGYKG